MCTRPCKQNNSFTWESTRGHLCGRLTVRLGLKGAGTFSGHIFTHTAQLISTISQRRRLWDFFDNVNGIKALRPHAALTFSPRGQTEVTIRPLVKAPPSIQIIQYSSIDFIYRLIRLPALFRLKIRGSKLKLAQPSDAMETESEGAEPVTKLSVSVY